MAIYNESVLAIAGTANMTAESYRTFKGVADSITASAAASTANSVYVVSPVPITGIATMLSVKSYKAIRSGLQNKLMDSFMLSGKMYFLNGADYFSYDGASSQHVTPYIPSLTISGKPGANPAGSLLEDFNLLGAGFKETYSGDGIPTIANPIIAPTLTQEVNAASSLAAATYFVVYTHVNVYGETLVSSESSLSVTAGNQLTVTIPALPVGATSSNIYISTATGTQTKQGSTTTSTYPQTTAIVSGAAKPISNTTSSFYQLSLKDLDATPIVAKIDNVVKVEGTDFTVDRVLGKVTFTTAPSIGTNNVEITAYKTQVGFPERIKKCTFHVLFGGTNDTRVFVSGNPDFPNQMWRSGLYDPTYFPENGFYKVGSEREKITGFVKQYDFLVIEKESSKGNMQYQLSGDEATFPIKPLNDYVGTIAPRTIQVIENNPISLGKTGVHILTQSNVRDERNIVHVSSNVDGKLLAEANLQNAISIDFDRKYWLSVNNKVYVYDYAISEWYIYDNIPASCFMELDGTLYFGGEGRLYKFKKENELNPYTDDGTPINAYWMSKYFTFEADHLRKVVDKVFFSMKPYTKTSADLYYTTDKKVSNLVKTKRMDLLDFTLFNFNFMSFVRSTFPQEVMVKIKAKKVTHFQLKLVNNKPDESFGLLSLGIKFRYGSEIK